ncbi:cellulase family glycosylhydrolase [Nocardioides carbamazepini]|uniref:cellulase family glycosylhydrolase n=1 Tax=Nocardioides carbamazepini TaxID=2854259 RepID=UPI00214A7132|nr:cellulase family glycosylhydrolase [Nocardioides carbamazepini]MCR1783708.1 cellulase family glycosylhydrolase [Nocardioides carbamazepini]
MQNAHRRWTWLAAVLAMLMIGAVAAVPPAQSRSTAGESLPSGDFETHLDGFAGVDGSRVALSRDGAGRGGSRAMVVRAKGRGPAATVSRHRFAGTHAAGTAYVVRVWVRTTAGHPVALRVREVAQGKKVQARTARATAKAGSWTRLKAQVTTKKRDSVLKLRIRAPHGKSGQKVLVDDLSVAPKGDAAASEEMVGKLTNGCGHTARGIPSCGTYVGAAHGSNTDPSTLEQQLGDRLAIRRTYFTSTGVASAVRTAQADLTAGRLPWVSFKLPYSWTEMADGKGDAWATDLAQRLAAVGGPVWVAFHHEPEGDGDIQEWRRMQEHLAPLVRKTAPNVAFTVVMTGWNQFYGDAQYSLAEIWPRGVKVDVAGFDIYQQYGVAKNGSTTTKWTDFEQYYRAISTWSRTVGVEWALGETGVTDVAAEARPSAIADAVQLMESYGGIAYSYFDSALNSVAPWTLSTTTKRTGFAQALAGSPSLK